MVRGRIHEVDQVEEYLGDYSIEDSGSALLPITVADTLVRGCRNLIHHYLKAEDPEKSGLFDLCSRIRTNSTDRRQCLKSLLR